VRHVEDADSRARDAAHDVEQLAELVVGERGGGLVEDQELGLDAVVPQQRARHGYAGLDRRAERRHGSAQVQVLEPDDGQLLARAGPRRATANGAPPGGEARVEVEVVEDRLGLDEAEVLVHEPAAARVRRLGRAERHRTAVDRDLARVRAVEPGQHLDEGGLAGPVLAEQGVDLPAVDREVHRAQRGDAAEGLAEAARHAGVARGLGEGGALGHPTCQSFLNCSWKSAGLS